VQFDKSDRKFRLKQSVAAAPNRLVRGKSGRGQIFLNRESKFDDVQRSKIDHRTAEIVISAVLGARQPLPLRPRSLTYCCLAANDAKGHEETHALHKFPEG
jgi:hypothetical protein